MGTRGTPVSKSTSKSEAEFPNGKQPVLWSAPTNSMSGIGMQYVVPNPKECDNFDHMICATKLGRKFKIAGKWWRILGVFPYIVHSKCFKGHYPAGIPILLEGWPYSEAL